MKRIYWTLRYLLIGDIRSRVKYRRLKPINFLPLKAIIYQYLGINLTQKELLRYLQSEQYFKEFGRIYNSDRTMSAQNVQAVLIGLWEANNGIYSLMVRENYPRPIKRLVIMYRTLKLDISVFFYRKKGKNVSNRKRKR